MQATDSLGAFTFRFRDVNGILYKTVTSPEQNNVIIFAPNSDTTLNSVFTLRRIRPEIYSLFSGNLQMSILFGDLLVEEFTPVNINTNAPVSINNGSTFNLVAYVNNTPTYVTMAMIIVNGNYVIYDLNDIPIIFEASFVQQVGGGTPPPLGNPLLGSESGGRKSTTSKYKDKGTKPTQSSNTNFAIFVIALIAIIFTLIAYWLSRRSRR